MTQEEAAPMEEPRELPAHELAEQSIAHIAELMQKAGNNIMMQAVVRAYVRGLGRVYGERVL